MFIKPTQPRWAKNSQASSIQQPHDLRKSTAKIVKIVRRRWNLTVKKPMKRKHSAWMYKHHKRNLRSLWLVLVSSRVMAFLTPASSSLTFSLSLRAAAFSNPDFSRTATALPKAHVFMLLTVSFIFFMLLWVRYLQVPWKKLVNPYPNDTMHDNNGATKGNCPWRMHTKDGHEGLT
jgi:hypothetical protein